MYEKIRRRLLSNLNTMTHWLTPLLAPKSIAIVGASQRAGSLAATTFQQLRDNGYNGLIFLVNPKYEQVFDQECFPTLKALPATPDLVVFVISGLGMEKSFDEALSLKVGGVVIYASNNIEEAAQPNLVARLRAKAAEAGIPVCGGNSMGFYNYDDHVFISFDRPPAGRPAGHIGLILHSGSGLTYLANNDARFCFNYVIASAQEINATAADYMDYLLDQPSTRVIALMLETVRDVPAFIAALQKARRKDIPVVITKLGRTEKSAELAVSHSGAIVGNHEAFVAACERHGVILCRDVDEMITTAMLFAAGYRMQCAGIASMLDSGGMRELMIDLADDYGLPFAEVSGDTKAFMQSHLEYGLVADNPLDAMGALGRNTEQTYLECGKALLDDPATGLLTFEFEFRDGFSHYPELFGVIDQLAAYKGKPLVVVNSCTFTSLNKTAAELCHRGIPMINGIDIALRAIRNLSRYQSAEPEKREILDFDTEVLKKWRGKLAENEILDELTSLELMADFNLPVVPHEITTSLNDALRAANQFGYPVVMKTAEPGIAHKSDCGGVIVSIENNQSLESAYLDLETRLGKRVLIMPMIGTGVEVSVGMKNDAQYGPLLILAAGGILIELLEDRVFKLAPVNAEQARTMLVQLKVSRLLAGVRGRPAADIDALIDLIVRFSQMIVALSDSIAEIDLNPVIVTQAGCTIVDALVVPERR